MKCLQGKKFGQHREKHSEATMYTADNKSKGLEETAKSKYL